MDEVEVEIWTEVIGKPIVDSVCPKCGKESLLKAKLVSGYNMEVVSVTENSQCLVCGFTSREPSSLSLRANR
jgi:predicted RNA-binding Zn-ribbon protein involved in translation (DUF1610 family)